LPCYRILTLGTAPFSVVQVNAAFHRFTGLTTGDVLGKPVLDLIVHPDDTLKTALEESAKNLKIIVARQQTFKAEGANKHPEQRVRISPVGTQLNAITHFAIELQSEDGQSDRDVTKLATSGICTARNSPMNVMG